MFDWANQPRNWSKPFAQLLRTHIIETMPVGEEDLLFGEPVFQRRIHSLRSLSNATGIAPRCLRNVLRAADVICAEQARQEFKRCTFDALEGEAIARLLAASLTREQIAEKLHVTHSRAVSLVKSGLIRPWLDQVEDQKHQRFGILPEDLEAFSAAIFADAEIVAEPSTDFLTVDQIANLTFQPVTAVFAAVLDGRFGSKQRIQGAPGITELRIYRNNALAAFQSPPQGAYRRLEEAAAWLAISQTALAILRELPQARAYFPTARIAFRDKRRLQAIPQAALDAFDRKYVTPAKLARELELSSWSMGHEVKKLNLIPVFDPEALGERFYCRRELEAGVATLSLKPRQALRGRSTRNGSPA
ncbi:MAG: hypothetical protein V2J51_10600 [Erythrobacter sp.]|nr:hypothetical protein [Erythrobacter sp.]